jgi:hypothetical protein
MAGTNRIINLSLTNYYRNYITKTDGTPFNTPDELVAFRPIGEPGDFAQVISTQSFWMWHPGASSWVNTDSGSSGNNGTTYWSDILNKPSEFPPSQHNHPISDITDLASSLIQIIDDTKEYADNKISSESLILKDYADAKANVAEQNAKNYADIAVQNATDNIDPNKLDKTGALENYVLMIGDGQAYWGVPRLTSATYIVPTGSFDTALRNAINNAVAGDVLDFTGWTGTHFIDSTNGTVNINKPLTLLFGTVTIKFRARGRTSHMFYITSSSVRIIGYGRSPNVNDLSGPTKFVMEIDTGFTNGGYHIKTWKASALRFDGFDLIGVRSNYNEVEGTFTGAGGIFIEKENPDQVSSGNNVNNLIINNVYIQGTVAHGIYVDTPIISRITNVRVSQAGRHGIFIKGGTSIVIDATYVSSAHLAGFCLYGVSYSSIIASAAENAGVGYWIRSCSAVNLFGSGAENCINKGSGNQVFGTGLNNSGILNYNGTVIDDCSADYRDIFRGTSYIISGGRNILLNGPYSINASLVGEAGTTSVLSAHFRIMSNARYIQILSPRCAMSTGNTFAGRFDLRIENVGTDYPRDCTIDFNPYVDGSVVPAFGKPYVTEINADGENCPVYNVGVNTQLRWGNTKWCFEKLFAPTSNMSFDVSSYDLFRADNFTAMTGNYSYQFTNPIKDKTVMIYLPPLGTAVISWIGNIYVLSGVLSTTAQNIVYVHCVSELNGGVYFITFSQPTPINS